MRVVRVTARAFGPYKDQTLELRPGLNVVGGPNESGKSTWNAAIRAALTGVKRGKGHPGVEAQQFADLHRPWDDPESWSVEARLVLDDGRQIDVVQDLAAKVASRATDVAVGEDVSREIIFEGSPDASVWLGLDREVFPRTIWVGQGEILLLAESADRLQEYLQRAAASRAGDTTVAEALERLEDYQKNAIGSGYATTKPLRSTRDRLQHAEAELKAARAQHVEYLKVLARAQATKAAHEVAAVRCRAMRAALALRSADELRAKLAQATALSARHATKPAGASERDDLSDQVAAALQAWRNRPQPETPTGKTAEELRRELEALPQPPLGDQEAAQAVVDAFEALNKARGALGSLSAEPDPGAALSSADLTESDLRGLAADLAAALQLIDPSAQERVATLRRQVASRGRVRNGLVIVALLTLATGIIGLTANNLVLVATGIALAAAFGIMLAIQQRHLGSAEARLSAFEKTLAPADDARRAAEARQAEARTRLQRAGLPVEPAALVALADAVQRHALVTRDREQWRAQDVRLRAALVTAEDRLRSALQERGAERRSEQPIDEVYRSYLAACHERKDASAAAQKRGPIEDLLRARALADATYATAMTRQEQAERGLGDVTGAACPDQQFATNEQRVAALEAWQRTRSARVVTDQVALEEWQELQALLGGQDLSALRRQTEDADHGAEDLLRGLPDGALPQKGDVSAAGLADLETTEHTCVTQKEHADAQLQMLAATMKDMAELEENVFSLTEEQERLESLDDVVSKTVELLRAAEERVQRDLAPVLIASIQRHLPAVTSGRYGEATVDPATLAVKVKEVRSGQWRPAARLSGGTREQIYLLLRIAMAEHLALKSETAPLFMDEVTAQSDAARAQTLIETIHVLSRDRQIVVFTHDRAILDWAKAKLATDRDQVIELTPTASGAVAEAVIAPAARDVPWWKTHMRDGSSG